ncbi:hypothetical protein CL658_03705 [bacterium]|nr:hypothetical protein [bacterium]
MKFAIIATGIAVVSAFTNPVALVNPRGSRRLPQDVSMKSSGEPDNLTEKYKREPLNLVLGMQDKRDECLVEPVLQPVMQTALERALITSIATLGLAVVLPPVKQLGLVGSVSWGHDIWKSAAAIGPIVTFTANMPTLLGHMMKSIPGFKELSDNSKRKIAMKVAILATIKHVWVWPYENKLNAISMLGNSVLKQNPEWIRRLAHVLREAVLIMCVGQQACRGAKDRFLSYANKAFMQAVFDRIAFCTNVNFMFTVVSRGLYLAAVKEGIDRTSQAVTKVTNKSE